MMLDREEYIEQAHFFRVVGQRLRENVPLQEMLAQAKQELLSTTRMPIVVDFFLGELTHSGRLAPAMKRLQHYFTAFQAYLMEEAEDERGRFDMRTAIAILQKEADHRATQPTAASLFLFQFESLSRNHLRYSRGLDAIGKDPVYDEHWREWIRLVNHQAGLVELADLLFIRSEYYLVQRRRTHPEFEPEGAVLFGEREGRIALANRGKDPQYLFAALQRQLGYPKVPRPRPPDSKADLLPTLMRRLEQLETRMRFMEEEQRHGAVDLTKLFPPPPST